MVFAAVGVNMSGKRKMRELLCKKVYCACFLWAEMKKWCVHDSVTFARGTSFHGMFRFCMKKSCGWYIHGLKRDVGELMVS